MNKDISNHDSPGQLQYFGSCCADAVINAYENMLNAKGLQYSAELSRLFLWYNSRKILNLEKTMSGVTCYSAINALTEQGICLEKDWQYFEQNVIIEPQLQAKTNAIDYKIINSKKIETLEQLKDSIDNNKPVVISTNVFGTNHAVCVVGYNEVSMTLKCKDSISNDSGNFYKEISIYDFEKRTWDRWSFDLPQTVPVTDKWMVYSWYRFLIKLKKYL